MRCFGLLLVLPLPAFGWWCETSDRHGCRGQSRHFVRAETNPFLVFEDIKTSYVEEPIVVDWDGDGDLDVILRKRDGFSLFEFKSGKHLVEVKPNPFHGIPVGDCRPAIVDWNGDDRLDLIVGVEDQAAKDLSDEVIECYKLYCIVYYYESQPVGLAEVIDAGEASFLRKPAGRLG